MKRLSLLLLLLLACSSLHARTFSYGVLVHRINEQVKVDVYAPFGEDHLNLSVTEAIALLKRAPRSRGANQIGVAVEGCSSSDYADLLKAIVDGSPEMELAYFGGFGADTLRGFIEQRRKRANP